MWTRSACFTRPHCHDWGLIMKPCQAAATDLGKLLLRSPESNIRIAVHDASPICNIATGCASVLPVRTSTLCRTARDVVLAIASLRRASAMVPIPTSISVAIASESVGTAHLCHNRCYCLRRLRTGKRPPGSKAAPICCCSYGTAQYVMSLCEP